MIFTINLKNISRRHIIFFADYPSLCVCGCVLCVLWVFAVASAQDFFLFFMVEKRTRGASSHRARKQAAGHSNKKNHRPQRARAERAEHRTYKIKQITILIYNNNVSIQVCIIWIWYSAYCKDLFSNEKTWNQRRKMDRWK